MTTFQTQTEMVIQTNELPDERQDCDPTHNQLFDSADAPKQTARQVRYHKSGQNSRTTQTKQHPRRYTTTRKPKTHNQDQLRKTDHTCLT